MKNQKTIIVGIIFGFIIAIFAGLLGVVLQEKKLDLINIDQVESGLSGGEVATLENYLWESLKNNHGFSEETRGIEALIRPSSWARTESESGEIVSYKFLMDIDELEATYAVSFALMKGQGFYEAPNVDCPLPSEAKYPGTCKSEKSSTFSVTVGRNLPYYLTLSDGRSISLTTGRDENGAEYISARVNTCGNETIVSKTEAAVQKWIAEGLGFEADDYMIKVSEVCDGEF